MLLAAVLICINLAEELPARLMPRGDSQARECLSGLHTSISPDLGWKAGAWADLRHVLNKATPTPISQIAFYTTSVSLALIYVKRRLALRVGRQVKSTPGGRKNSLDYDQWQDLAL